LRRVVVNRFASGTRVSIGQDVFKFAFAAMTSTVISPTLGVTSLALGGFAAWANYGAIWITGGWRHQSDLVVAPLIIFGRSHGLAVERRKLSKSFCFDLAVTLVNGLWRVVPISAQNYPISFICGPVVLWTAFRFSQRETVLEFSSSPLSQFGARSMASALRHGERKSISAYSANFTAVLTVTAWRRAAMTSAGAPKQPSPTEAAVEAANRTKDNFLAMLSMNYARRLLQ